ncbi:CLUMA_CG020509, isoform A [Clunio marinus]|uniref:CLUMA_CG020509, isoform A n=1 Tax=Clunio marinus TaxID=568069 RepID=A0A1J1J564_9DIPT|nr:CLUMA_CG020509, isoform A [Clunio marinus]
MRIYEEDENMFAGGRSMMSSTVVYFMTLLIFMTHPECNQEKLFKVKITTTKMPFQEISFWLTFLKAFEN